MIVRFQSASSHDGLFLTGAGPKITWRTRSQADEDRRPPTSAIF